MDFKALERLREVKVQEYLCRLMSSKFEDIGNSELHPLLVALKVIKDEYAFNKPEVYRTLITILYDYNPCQGEEHRAKTVRYISILLGGRPELAEYLTRILPTAACVEVQEDSLVVDRGQSENNFWTKISSRSSTVTCQPTVVVSEIGLPLGTDHTQTTAVTLMAGLGEPVKLATAPLLSELLSEQPRSVNVAGTVPLGVSDVSRQVPVIITKETRRNPSPHNTRVLLVKPVNSVFAKTSKVDVSCPVAVSDKFSPSCRFILNDKKLVGTSHSTTVSQVMARHLAPKGVTLNWPVKTRISAPTVGVPTVVRPMLRTRMLIFNKAAVQKKIFPLAAAGPSDNAAATTDRESPLLCIEQLLANARTDISQTISDVDLGVDDVHLSSCSESSMIESTIESINESINVANMPPTPLDLSVNSCVHSIDKSLKTRMVYESTTSASCTSPSTDGERATETAESRCSRRELSAFSRRAGRKTASRTTNKQQDQQGLAMLDSNQQDSFCSFQVLSNINQQDQQGSSCSLRVMSNNTVVHEHPNVNDSIQRERKLLVSRHVTSGNNVALDDSNVNDLKFEPEDELWWYKAPHLKRKPPSSVDVNEQSKRQKPL